MSPIDKAAALSGLRRANFDYARDLHSIWTDNDLHVEELNGNVLELIYEEFIDRTEPGASNPLGRLLIGQAGTGKTHLIGALRRRVWESGGFFVLIDLLDVSDFWETASLGFVDALARRMADGRNQGEALLGALCARMRLPMQAMTSPKPGLFELGAKGFLAGLREIDPAGATAHRDVATAFAALCSGDPILRDLARAWLMGSDVREPLEAGIGVLNPPLTKRSVAGLSWLMSLAGPTLCAVDQIDAIVSVAHSASGDEQLDGASQRRARAVIDSFAGGLMDIRDVTRRTMTVLSLLDVTLEVLLAMALASFRGRFHEPVRLGDLSKAETARAMVEQRLAPAYAKAGFVPPYPSWPFAPTAFTRPETFTPRSLLQACEAHRTRCRLAGRVDELIEFFPTHPAADAVAPVTAVPSELDTKYDEARSAARIADLLDSRTEPTEAVILLRAALRALVDQTVAPSDSDISVDIDPSGLHARLRRVDFAAGGREQHHGFVIIPHTHYRTVQTRLRAAMTGSGIDRDLPFRKLIVLRREPWPKGSATAGLVRDFERSGGRVLVPTDEDWRRFAAIRALYEAAPAGLQTWLRTRRPMADAEFFRALGLIEQPGPSPTPAPPPATPPPATPPAATPPPATPPEVTGTDTPGRSSSVPLGVRVADKVPVALPLALLSRHVAVIAGSGSGKTVFLRRLIEETALAGVPAIVIDGNNDLVCLADPWPARPSSFTDEDDAKAARYQDSVEVVVWTPGLSRGNPLFFPALPDFTEASDVDERAQAVEMAAAALAPRVPTSGQNGHLRLAVLKDALRHFAAGGGGGLNDLVALLRDLPPDVSAIGKAAKFADEIADSLLAARANDPLFDGAGTPLDPATLLHGASGRTRISVINVVGLPDDTARQGFVGRLLMALFSHVRRHPPKPGGRPLQGLLVMDEAPKYADAQQASPSRVASVALARQARKYGLGLVFATQGPRTIDTNIIGNCTTQVFGKMNAPAAIDAAREMMASRGAAPDDMGKLATGTFYITTEGAEQPRKFTAPLCLTRADLTPSEDDVVARAARGRRDQGSASDPQP